MDKNDPHAARLRASRDALIDEICNAFADVTRTNGVSLREAEVIDDWGSEEEQAFARLSETDTHWSEVPARQLEKFHAVPFLDGIGFRYYAPSFMCHQLRAGHSELDDELDSRDSGTPEGFILRLQHVGIQELTGTSQSHEWLSMLNKVQRTAISRFLAFEAELGASTESNDALIALQRGWHIYLRPEDRTRLSVIWPEIPAQP